MVRVTINRYDEIEAIKLIIHFMTIIMIIKRLLIIIVNNTDYLSTKCNSWIKTFVAM